MTRMLDRLQLAPEHQRHQLRKRDLLRRSHADAPAVAQHRQPVGDGVNLIEEMRDEDDGEAARLQLAHDVEEPRGLGGVETGGRLVEHQRARVVLERAGDGDELLDGDGIGAERPLHVDFDAEPLQTLARAGAAPRASRRARSASADGRA